MNNVITFSSVDLESSWKIQYTDGVQTVGSTQSFKFVNLSCGVNK